MQREVEYSAVSSPSFGTVVRKGNNEKKEMEKEEGKSMPKGRKEEKEKMRKKIEKERKRKLQQTSKM